MQKIYDFIASYYLLLLAILIQILFYISASSTGWLNIFFSGAALHHCCRGMDFYQVPRGAWAFWHNGSLTGTPLPDSGAQYYPGHSVNSNVYHPGFTFVLGSFLMLFNAAQSFYVWMFIKVIITLCAVGYFYRQFQSSKYVQLGVFILLANASSYMELDIAQFQSVLNIFILLTLITLTKKKDWLWPGLWFGFGLLVKPIGLLLIPALLCKRKYGTVAFGLVIFCGLSIPFLVHDADLYYYHNLLLNLLHPSTFGPNQIITLGALLHYSAHWPDAVYKFIQYGALALILVLSTLRRIHINKAVFLFVVYFLLFYDLVYEYDYSTLAPVIAICLVTLPEFQTRLARIATLLTCLPSAYVVLKVLHINIVNEKIYGFNPTIMGWQIMVVSKLVPALLLCGIVLAADMKPIFNQLKAFWAAMVKVNEHLEVCGEAEKVPEAS